MSEATKLIQGLLDAHERADKAEAEVNRLRKIIDGMECFCGDWIGKCPPCKAKLEADKNTELEKLIDSAKCPECDGCGYCDKHDKAMSDRYCKQGKERGYSKCGTNEEGK